MQPNQNHTEHESDAIIWNECRYGNEKAFDLIYDKYFSVLYGYGMQFCQNKALIKDCIQDLFIELWTKKGSLPEVHAVKYYLFQCIRRKVIKTITKKNFLGDASSSVEFHLQSDISTETAIINEEIVQDNAKRIQCSLDRLTSRQREAVFLKFYESLSYNEIALIMHLSDAKYARKLIYRSLKELKLNCLNAKTV
ncbi:MAG: sigma-70 family RNA polymerase sigma factor [Fulvivirga sp.]|uniref:RNA polymerase sigma factor n=1 Tax=Fulvivirga sp. TaxID=1931237 RepID=UPI0032ECA108